MRRAERLQLPGGRELVLGWAEVGAEDDATLRGLEREGLARCRTAKRRREFVAGRLAAHRALERLEPGARAEVTARAEGPDAGRPLLVPERGLALSISHSTGLAVAVLARGGALGVDLEERVEAGEPSSRRPSLRVSARATPACAERRWTPPPPPGR
ncbi:4'-phosphopantetheinyl transferase family protein [Cystobacter fuscus]